MKSFSFTSLNPCIHVKAAGHTCWYIYSVRLEKCCVRLQSHYARLSTALPWWNHMEITPNCFKITAQLCGVCVWLCPFMRERLDYNSSLTLYTTACFEKESFYVLFLKFTMKQTLLCPILIHDLTICNVRRSKNMTEIWLTTSPNNF